MRDTKLNFLRLLDENWPVIRGALLRSTSLVRSRIVLADLQAAIERSDADAAFRALRMSPGSLYDLDEAISSSVVAGGRYQMESARHETARMPAGARVVQSFDGRNERAERVARELSSQLITEITDDTRVLVRQAVTSGLEAGRNPRALALEITGRMQGGVRRGGLVGLHSTQARYVENLRSELTDPSLMENYFTRTRRDRRLDGIVRRAMREERPVKKAMIDKIAGRYSDRLLALRGETIGRTESLRSLNAGRQEGMDQLLESGELVHEQVKKRWDDTGDGRTRESHMHADGQTVDVGQPFIVGGYRLMFPGDTSLGAPASETVNCRCYFSYVIDYLHQRLAA